MKRTLIITAAAILFAGSANAQYGSPGSLGQRLGTFQCAGCQPPADWVAAQQEAQQRDMADQAARQTRLMQEQLEQQQRAAQALEEQNRIMQQQQYQRRRY